MEGWQFVRAGADGQSCCHPTAGHWAIPTAAGSGTMVTTVSICRPQWRQVAGFAGGASDRVVPACSGVVVVSSLAG
jgi:hypothetical protein